MNIEVRGGHCGAQQRWSVVVPHAPEEEIGGAVCRAEVEVEGGKGGTDLSKNTPKGGEPSSSSGTSMTKKR